MATIRSSTPLAWAFSSADRAPHTSRTSWIAPHSNADPRAIWKYLRRSPSVALPLPSAMLRGIACRSTEQLFLRTSMSLEPLAEMICPTDVLDGGPVDVQSLVPEAHAVPRFRYRFRPRPPIQVGAELDAQLRRAAAAARPFSRGFSRGAVAVAARRSKNSTIGAAMNTDE